MDPREDMAEGRWAPVSRLALPFVTDGSFSCAWLMQKVTSVSIVSLEEELKISLSLHLLLQSGSSSFGEGFGEKLTQR